MSVFEVFLIVLLAALVVGLYWVILRISSQKIAVQYEALSKNLDLELNKPSPVMAGFIRPEPSVYGEPRDREISISVPGKGMQNTRQIETVLKIELKDQNFSAQIAPNGILGGIRQRDGRGMQKWQSGDTSFDTAFDVRVKDEKLTSLVLDETLRERMKETFGEGKGSLYIGAGVLAYAELGLISNETTRRRFEDMVNFLSDFATAVESAESL